MHIYEVHLLKGIYRGYQCHSTPKDDVTQCNVHIWTCNPQQSGFFTAQCQIGNRVVHLENGVKVWLWKNKFGNIAYPIDLYNCLFRQRNHRNGRILFRWHHQQFHVKISNVQKKMHKPEFYRRQNQQANPTQQQMPTPIIRRITCERKNWRPFFHQKIQMRVKKTREKYFIFFKISPVFQPRLQRNLQRRQRSANQSPLKPNKRKS